MNKLFYLVSLILLCGCGGVGTTYSSVRDIPRSGWRMGQVCEFEFGIDRELRSCDVFVDIRTQSSYPWENIFVECEMLKADETLFVDTLEFVLSDKSGLLLGKGVSTLRENSFVLKQNFVIKDTGVYRIKVKHLMRKTNIKGVNSIGVRIESSQPEK